jgi:predicted Zn-dependent protease
MKKNKVILFLLVTTLFLCSCGTTSTVPITGRKQHLLVSDEQVMSLSNEQYQSYMKTAKPSTNAANTAMVRRVGERLANAVETYLRQHNLASEVSNYKWEFNLVQDKQANAFCMPGGKIVVYEGLLPYTQNEASLAVVLGHEIAHAVAKHSAERMSQQMKAQYGAQALSLILGGSSSATQEIAQQVYGLGAQYGVMLPYSRNNESEADYMGLIFAAMAGYDPNVAVSFWQRMSQAGSGTPEFMSDHPSDASRIAAIQKEMPEALKYYKGNNSVRTINFSHKKSNRR